MVQAKININLFIYYLFAAQDSFWPTHKKMFYG